jgi:hypothetical protein
MVTGKESPLKTNSGLLLVPEDTTTLVPVALSVPVLLLVVPTVTLPKFSVDGETDNDPAALPLPASEMLIVGLVETTEMAPLALPALRGANTELKVTLWPAVNVRGAVTPCWLNPVPVVVTFEMVTLLVPVLVSVSGNVSLFPTCTLPKLRLDGTATRPPAVMPVPDNGTVSVASDALLVMVRSPLTGPVELGAKVMEKEVL